jgi:transcriptional regulator with XRE-family HTH domain
MMPMTVLITGNNLGRYVQARRSALGLRAEEVGAAVGKSQSWISRLETGAQKTFPEPEEIAGLAAVLQITPRELLEAAGYLPADESGDQAMVNPFAVDDPRWALVEALKGAVLDEQQVTAVTGVVMAMAEKSRDI